MANLVSVERAALALGTTHILDGVSLGVSSGTRVGVVGRNGGGKTTLLRVLAGFQQVDAGRVTMLGSLTVGMLTQVDTLDPAATIRTAVLGDLPEHVWAGDPRIRDILDGLLGGIDASDVGGLGLAVALTASGVAPAVKRAVGPVRGAHIVTAAAGPRGSSGSSGSTGREAGHAGPAGLRSS